MNARNQKSTIGADRQLATFNAQLLGWAKLLKRAGISKAEDILQELFHYLVLVSPDLSGIAYLDGYLCICLRNFYCSGLPRTSREGLHLVSAEDYAFAVASTIFAGPPAARRGSVHGFLAGLRTVGASALAVGVLLTVLMVGITHRQAKSRKYAAQILNDSIRQVVRMDETSASGEVPRQGVVVLWRDGDGNRDMRRLFAHVSGEGHRPGFERTEYDRKPSGSVSDAIFNPDKERRPTARPRDMSMTNALLAELQIDVLYQLQAIHADTGVPIEVARTAENRIRVSGTVDVEALKEAIVARLKSLHGHERLDLKIALSRELVTPFAVRRAAAVEAYEVTQPGFAADLHIRQYFLGKGLSGTRLDAAVALFCRDALQHAQQSLQHAYALDRLASSLSAAELRAIPPVTRQEWTTMVNYHAVKLENELRALHAQLAEITLAGVTPEPAHPEAMNIDEPAQFAITAGQLLGQVRQLNLQTGELFTSRGKTMMDTNLDASLQTNMNLIPLLQAGEVAAFAARLSGQTSASQTR